MKNQNMLKKILKRTFLVVFILIALALIAPFIFEKQIIQLVKREVNSSINANIDFADVNISFFRNFPRVSLALDQFKLTGKDEFSNDTLLSADRINATVNFMSLIKGSDYKIYSIDIEAPRIHAIVLENGKANWDIALPDTTLDSTSRASAPYKLELEKYTITNGYISYRDAPGNMNAEIINLDHEGSGDFTADLFTMKTRTAADAVSFSYDGIPYLSRTKTIVNADLQVDNPSGKYTFKTEEVTLNDLQLHTEGFFQMLDDAAYNMDIRFKSPSTDFKKLLSLVPMIYQKDFASVKTSGTAIFNGFIRGKYSDTQMPGYTINLDVKDGFFQYPDLPRPVKNINLSMKIDNPDGVTDHTVINIPRAHVEIDNDPFDFHLNIQHPVSDMFIDAGAKGQVDLSKISQLVKLEKNTRLSGMLDADIMVKGLVSAMQKQDFDKFSASGKIDLEKFFYASNEYPGGVSLQTLHAAFHPKNIMLNNVVGQYLNTSFSANGSIDNLLAYVVKNQSLSGVLNIKADAINLNDWMGTTADTTTAIANETLPTPSTTSSTSTGTAFLVPRNLNFDVNAAIDKVLYDKVEMKNVTGSMRIADETVLLKNMRANTLDGTMIINGTYSTKLDQKKPDISLTYDLQGLDVQKTFYAFNTIQKMMPIGKFISGKLSSKMTMTGKLGEDMMPDLTTLTGNGNLFLIEGFLKKFAPVEKMANVLQVEQLQNIALKDVKNFISFNNGKVMVKPFNLKVKGIEMEIGGSHGFDQSLNYVINMKIPRSMMGTKGNQYVDQLVAQVNSKGIPLKAGEVVNLKVNMGGFISNPEIITNLKEAATSMVADLKQQATDFARAKVDTAKKMVKDSVTALKNQVIGSAKDELLKKLGGTKDSSGTSSPVNAGDIKKKAAGTGKEMMKSLFGKKG